MLNVLYEASKSFTSFYSPGRMCNLKGLMAFDFDSLKIAESWNLADFMKKRTVWNCLPASSIYAYFVWGALFSLFCLLIR